MAPTTTSPGAPASIESAVVARDWRGARELLEAADSRAELDAAGLALLAEMRVLTGDAKGGKSTFERAVAAYQALGDLSRAAITATHLWRLYRDNAEGSKATGWLRRAARFVAKEPKSVGAGHVMAIESFRIQAKGDLAGALDLATRAHDIAIEADDPELESVALSRQGRLHIRLGNVDEGQVLLDEAMTIVQDDRVPPILSAVVYCTVIDACTDLADYERAYEWTASASSYCESGAVGGFPGICRIHRAELLRMRGRWREAAEEAECACAVLNSFGMNLGVAMGEAEVGMVKLRLGDLDAADEAFTAAHRKGFNAQPGRSQLMLARGDVDGAKSALDRCIIELEDDPLGRAKMLPTRVEVALATGDTSAAVTAAADLSDIASRFSSNGLAAFSANANAAVALAQSDAEGAITAANKAVGLWTTINAPCETSKARLLLADAYEQAGDLSEAKFEREAAAAALSDIGLTIALGSADTMAVSPTFSAFAATQVPDANSPSLSAVSSNAVVSAGPVASSQPHPGTRFGDKLELIRVLGQGGMGTVMEARHLVTGRAVAVKLLNPGMGNNPAHCQRLLAEALACGSVKHENVIDVYDAGEFDGTPYIVMELLAGQSLAERIDNGPPLSRTLVLDIARQALAGLAAAHGSGIVHRDLKPDNLFLAGHPESPTVKLLDFGISKFSAGTPSTTKTGALLGTPSYMAPEQIYAPSKVDGRADLYSLGIVLFEMLCGKVPFVAESYPALLVSILNDPFPCIGDHCAEADAQLKELIASATARDRTQRYADCAEFTAAISAMA
ncbi:MAG: serine/threonine protein kinase [Polyangiaceae bacterium]|nr:serine/threonine protein kinase [Polyangiaceae bacterium]